MQLPIDLQPTLTGNLIEIRPLKREDFAALFAAASDPLIWKQHPESDRYKKEVFLRFFESAIDSKGAFAVVDRKSGKIIGSSRYWNFKPEKSEIEIGWTFLERAFWGGAYNGELKSLMLKYAFRFVENVLLIVGENNLRSQKAVEKIGGKFLRHEERAGSNGRIGRNVVFVITRQEFQNRERARERTLP